MKRDIDALISRRGRIYTLRAAGVSYRAIGELLGLSPQRIEQIHKGRRAERKYTEAREWRKYTKKKKWRRT